MATVREIKNRIGSVKNIKKITETMEKISTAKVKKTTDRLMNSRDYYFSLVRMMAHVIPFVREEKEQLDHPLIRDHEDIKNSLILVISSNRGLCGGYNNNVLQVARRLYNSLQDEKKDVHLYTIGKKGLSYFKYLKIPVEKSIIDIDDNVTYERMNQLAEELSELYSTEQVNEIYLVYTKFFSPSQQKPVVERVLPFEFEVEEEEVEEEFRAVYSFEPKVDKVLEYVVPLALKTKLFNTILETNLSEQIARKIAMKQASDSAGDMIKNLTLLYNRARQSKITKEIIEIIGAAKALTS